MRQDRVSIPRSKSTFILIQCENCGNERVIFSNSAMDIKCEKCNEIIVKSTGGKSKISGSQVRRVDW